MTRRRSPLCLTGRLGRAFVVGGPVTLLLVMVACDAQVYVRTSGINGDAGVERNAGDGAASSGGSDGSNVGSGGSVLISTGGVGGSGGRLDGSSGGVSASGGATATGGVGTGGAVISTGGSIASTGGAASGGRGTGGAGSGGIAATGGMIGSGGAGTGGAAATDTAKYNFETSAQSWASVVTPAFMSVARSTTRRYAGQAALAGTFTATAAGIYQLGVAPTPAVPAGATLTFHVYFPAGSTIDWIQPYALAGSVWSGNYRAVGALTPAAWNTIAVMVPTPSGTIGEIGVQFHVTGAWSGTVYVDSVNW